MMKATPGLLILALLFSCASKYHPILPASIYYSRSEQAGRDLDVAYKYEVLRERGNKKYAKREDSKAIRLVSVRVKNNSLQPVTIGENAFFYSGDSELRLLDPVTIQKSLKQGVAIYLLYLLFTPMNLYTSDGSGGVESTPIGLIVGPGLSVGNMLGASGANQSFLAELNSFSLINKRIAPGETVYGLIGVYNLDYSPIQLKIR